jgi:DNA-binding CsgD family transcriptional regulator
MPRPKSDIDIIELEKLCSMQCTDDEIAAFLGVSARTLDRRKKNAAFREVMERGKARGRVSVRRHLFRLANNGNIAACIFLAKNLLGYRDVVNNEHSGPAGGPIEIASRPDLSQLSDEELRQLKQIAGKARSKELSRNNLVTSKA